MSFQDRRSTRRPHEDTNVPSMYVYYCICGEFVLVCHTPLHQVPRRPMDQAYVLRCLDSPEDTEGRRKHAHIYKIHASQGPSQIILRPDGRVERQYVFHCTRCNLPVGYEHTPPPLKSGGKFTFLYPGALTYVLSSSR